MRIAIPTADNGLLSMHFGHCSTFSFIDVDTETKHIDSKTEAEPPPHEPGVLPKWLHEHGVDLVIAGGMGMRAQQLFHQAGVKVNVGAPAKMPEDLVNEYLNGELEFGNNVCDH